mmetsp:Transcript_78732/g.218772  ORF Transcript_78732/g.218772 Transcript_78732/m.218772 type:complete len:230 (+) Transcript_78732:1567-2256(+)
MDPRLRHGSSAQPQLDVLQRFHHRRWLLPRGPAGDQIGQSCRCHLRLAGADIGPKGLAPPGARPAAPKALIRRHGMRASQWAAAGVDATTLGVRGVAAIHRRGSNGPPRWRGGGTVHPTAEIASGRTTGSCAGDDVVDGDLVTELANARGIGLAHCVGLSGGVWLRSGRWHWLGSGGEAFPSGAVRRWYMGQNCRGGRNPHASGAQAAAGWGTRAAKRLPQRTFADQPF